MIGTKYIYSKKQQRKRRSPFLRRKVHRLLKFILLIDLLLPVSIWHLATGIWHLHFAFRIYNRRSPLICHLPFPICEASGDWRLAATLRISHFAFRTSHFALRISHFAFLIPHSSLFQPHVNKYRIMVAQIPEALIRQQAIPLN